VVVMTGSPNASAYPEPSAEVWAKRVKEEISTAQQRTEKFQELSTQTKTKAQKDKEAKRKKKAAEDAKFKARQQALRDEQEKEREQRLAARKAALATISVEHETWQKEQMAQEELVLRLSGVLPNGEVYPIANEVFTDLKFDETLQGMFDSSVEALYQQHSTEEANQADKLTVEKAYREAKAAALREGVLEKQRAEKKAATDLAYQIKKDMAIETKRQNQVEETHQKAKEAAGDKGRHANVHYGEWLKQDHIRTIAERSHERADPSKMHEGGKFSGIPTDFTPGV